MQICLHPRRQKVNLLVHMELSYLYQEGVDLALQVRGVLRPNNHRLVWPQISLCCRRTRSRFAAVYDMFLSCLINLWLVIVFPVIIGPLYIISGGIQPTTLSVLAPRNFATYNFRRPEFAALRHMSAPPPMSYQVMSCCTPNCGSVTRVSGLYLFLHNVL